jgi:hypothetical protein
MAPPTLEERVAVAKRHLEMSIDWKGERLGVFETRRHYTNYFRGIQHFKPYRSRLVSSDDSADVFAVFEDILREVDPDWLPKFGDRPSEQDTYRPSTCA